MPGNVRPQKQNQTMKTTDPWIPSDPFERPNCTDIVRESEVDATVSEIREAGGVIQSKRFVGWREMMARNAENPEI